MRDAAEALPVLRHDCQPRHGRGGPGAVPGTQVTIGPPIEDGWYYDFARDEPFSLRTCPHRGQDARDHRARRPFTREVVARQDAIARFEGMGEAYKAEIIQDLPEDAEITVYHQGAWQDLCKGPHLPSTGQIGKAFKLTKLAGAYWRGDSNKAQLQRIYGTAWTTEAELQAHLQRIEEAEKRDHRRIGRQMDLFHMQEEGRGMVFWHRQRLDALARLEKLHAPRLKAAGYFEVKTPQVLDRTFWESRATGRTTGPTCSSARRSRARSSRSSR
jgi:threonyl-tRNA synthetase